MSVYEPTSCTGRCRVSSADKVLGAAVIRPRPRVLCAQAAGYTGKVKIGMDVAASEFLTKEGQYDLNFKEKDNDGSQVLSP